MQGLRGKGVSLNPSFKPDTDFAIESMYDPLAILQRLGVPKESL